jgi:DNA-binding GntR family transcriptional regulator
MPIEYKNLNRLVYERLRNEILEAKLPPGTRIKQEELTKRLGVSRTPIREAIQRLEMEGLVQFVRRSSVIVSPISRAKIEEIFDLRALLESYAAERAADNLTDKDFKKLRKLISEMDEHYGDQEIERLLAKNDEFHRLICQRAGNNTLLEMVEEIWRDIKRLRINYLITEEGHQRSTREHEQLVNALERHDKKVIRDIANKHAMSTKTGILGTLKLPEHSELEAVATS